MSRESNDFYENGRLIAGYDYVNQAWVIDGRYVTCGHPETMTCDCYGRLHIGETTEPGRLDGSDTDERGQSTPLSRAHNEAQDKHAAMVEKDAARMISARIARLNCHMVDKMNGKATGYSERITAARIDELRMIRDRIEGHTEDDTGPDDLPASTAKALRETFTTFKG